MGTSVLVTGGTKKDIDAMAVLALNVKEKTPELAREMIVFHDGVSEEIQSKFQEIMPTRFIRYKCPIPKYKLWQNKIIRYFSPMVFCKIECLKLLEEYETVIWSDYDVIIKEDIKELLNIDKSYSFICDPKTKFRDMFYKTFYKKNTNEFNLDDYGLCMSLFIFNKFNSDYIEHYNWCIQAMRKYIRYIYLPEQAIISMMLQKYNIDWGKVNNRTYCTHPKDDSDDVKIIHAYGQPKFWNGLENSDWNRYFQMWLDIKNR